MDQDSSPADPQGPVAWGVLGLDGAGARAAGIREVALESEAREFASNAVMLTAARSGDSPSRPRDGIVPSKLPDRPRRGSMNLSIRQPFLLPNLARLHLQCERMPSVCKLLSFHNVTLRLVSPQPPQNPSEKPQCPSAVGGVQMEPAEHHPQVVPVSFFHQLGRVFRLGHDFFDQPAEDVQIARGGRRRIWCADRDCSAVGSDSKRVAIS